MLATTLTAGLLALINVLIAISTIRHRRKNLIGLGHGGDPSLRAHVGAHSNFVSYSTGFIFVLAVCDYQYPKYLLGWMIVGVLFCVFRLIHFYGLTVQEIKNKNYLWRQVAMVYSLLSLMVLGSIAVVTPLLKLL